MSDRPEPPYAADLRAKGWRFELDHERIEQSDTWALAPAELRPWLLMLWMTAWRQVPCGSLPNDEALIAVRIGMPAKIFAKSRTTLLRGWVEASDGRLYHSFITSMVQAMLDTKDKEKARKAEYRKKMDEDRARKSAGVPRDNDGTDGGRTAESGGRDDTGTSTGTGTGTGLDKGDTPQPPKGGKRRARESADDGLPHGFPEFWAEYPRKDAKADAVKAWKAIRLHIVTDNLEPLMAGLRAWRRNEQWAKDGGKFIPLPATFLRGMRWLDEAVTGRKSGPQLPGAATLFAPKPGTDEYFALHRDAAWWRDAGFPNVYEAHNGGCWDWNAHLFRDGRKLPRDEEAHA